MQTLKKNTDFIFKKVKGETVMLNIETGDYFGLNEVGTAFLMLTDGKTPTKDIIKALHEKYEISFDTLQSDIKDLISKMIEKNILTEVK